MAFTKHLLILGMLLSFISGSGHAEDVQVAVAANFLMPLKEIGSAFTAQTGHHLKIVSGSSGSFYAQIKNGAPFQIFMSADEEKPQALEKAGLTVPGTCFTYATGVLALWSPNPALIDARGAVLAHGDFRNLAIANARLAPYGKAAEETLTTLHLKEKLQPRFITGNNISQTFEFIRSGNAELGFVALSQIMKDHHLLSGSTWVVPKQFYAPIKQDAVLLMPGKESAAAKALLAFLHGNQAKRIVTSYGYVVQ